MDGFFEGWRWNEIGVAAGIAIISVLLWHVPIINIIFFPFRLFATLVHEVGHGLAAGFTGGSWSEVQFRHRDSAYARVSGNGCALGCSGYLATGLVGSILLFVALSGVQPELTMIWIGLGVGLITVLFVRGSTGIVAGIIIAGMFFLAGRLLSAALGQLLLLFTAVQLVMFAFGDLITQARLIPKDKKGETDAMMMKRITGIPAILWVLLWIALSVGFVLIALRASQSYLAVE